MIEVALTQGHVARIDDSDGPEIRRWRWKILKTDGLLYASRTSGTSTILMHRQILGAKRGQYVDHRDHDGLNNQRYNIRLATQSQNLANTRKTRGKSQFKGVYWNKEKCLWQAQISAGAGADGKWKVRYIGRFSDEDAAARAYDAVAVATYGEFALINFPKRE